MQEIPYGYCHCGCGQKTSVSKITRNKRGLKKGEHPKYLQGHNRHPLRIIQGARFSRLVVLEKQGEFTLCKCDCGTEKKIRGDSLTKGETRSCGCFHRELASSRKYKHGAAIGGVVTPTYKSWQGMLRRCNNSNDKGFKYYGARGIAVCDRWASSYQNFLEDMGEKPHGLTIERKNNDLGYTPENCVWATTKQQNRNKRGVRRVTVGERTQIVTEWAEELGINPFKIYRRLNVGMSAEDALRK